MIYLRSLMKYQYNHDEINLFKLLNILSDGKIIILLCTVVLSVISFFYVSNSNPFWTSQVFITKLSNKNEVLKKQPVISLFVILKNARDNDINELNNILDRDVMLKMYVSLFNSIENKNAFFNRNNVLKKELNDKYFLENIKILSYSKDTYKITLKMINEKASYDLLSSYITYITYIDKMTNHKLAKKINIIIQRHVEFYKQEKYILEKIANRKLKLDIDKANYELEMVKDNRNEKDVRDSYNILNDFLIDNLTRKINLLKTFKDSTVFEPQLIAVDVNLETLKDINIKNSVFNKVGVIKVKDFTTTKNNYNAIIITLISSIIGMIFGCLIVLIRYVFKKQ
ncbi:hypothetical protein GLP25_18225 [Photobacterium phosphoreum]|nr:hypothetical protein [Photobacterium phosphoreum]